MIEAYTYLHEDGCAHSVEVWDTPSGELVGGLYGIGMGRMFFGESMFSRASNASKAGFITLAARLHELGITCIDCQQDTPHMRTLGSFLLEEGEWLETLRANHRYMLFSGMEGYSL
jgi:leucyl/phenylalanyl-tRNA--protein transferase